MLLPIKPICPINKIRRDGTCAIFFQYCFNAKQRTLLNTRISIPPLFWSSKLLAISDQLPIEYGNHVLLNEELLRLRRIVEDLVYHAGKKQIEDRISWVKANFSPSVALGDIGIKIKFDQEKKIKEKKDKLNIYYQFDEYIKSKDRKVSKATVTVYKNVKSHLLAFEKYRKQKIEFASFDFSFYEDFIDYLTFEHVHMRRATIMTGLKLNTIGKTIKHLRGFVKDRVKRKIIPSIDLSDFKIPEEEIDAIYLTHEEIASMYTVDLSNHPHLIEYRDLLVLACLTGLRFSDFSTLKPEDLQKDMLYKKQEKSDHWVIIPLREEAKFIFTRQFKDNIPSLTNPEFNKHIKTIGKLCGINRPIKFSFKKGKSNH